MTRIKKITKLTNNKFLNLYSLEAINKKNNTLDYYVASRRDINELKLKTKDTHADAVMVYSIYGDNKDKIVLVKQYRYPIDAFVYEFPVGLIDKGENVIDAGCREFYEETGLSFTPIEVNNIFSKAYYTSVGMTDEAISTIYGYSNGEINYSNLEDNEDLEVVIADKKEVLRILKEEQVAIKCAYLLQHFLKSNNTNPFDFLEIENLKKI